MEARKRYDGTFHVTWSQALWLSNFTKVHDPDTGEVLRPDRRLMAKLGALAGFGVSTTIVLAFVVWQHFLRYSSGFAVAVSALVAVASIWIGVALVTSEQVTFRKGDSEN